MRELEVHILDSEVIVNLVGTRCTITFARDPGSRELTEMPFWTYIDARASISLAEFRDLAKAAAESKIRARGEFGERRLLVNNL